VSTWSTVVLAAGFGERLAPLTDTTPKPLIPIGAAPLVEHIVGRLRTCGLPDPVVVVNHRHPDQWEAWRSATVAADAVVVDNGVVDSGERRGAVADLRAAMDAGGVDRSAPWMVVAGDNLVAAEDLAAMVDRWTLDQVPLVACRDLGDAPGREFGEVTLGPDGRIVRFREKPAQPTSSLAATCTYVLPPDAPAAIDRYLDDGGDADSPGRFIAWLSARRRVDAHLLGGDYHDIGTPETLAAARAAVG
jgi:NDP-sugar pyrophosphorylase family protein